MSELLEAAKKAADAMENVCEGCLGVKEDPDTHKEAKTLSLLVRRDLIRPLNALREALENSLEKTID